MPKRIARVPKLTPRQKEVYAHLCRKLRFPLVYGHARGCYLAINDALQELHGADGSPPVLSEAVTPHLSKRSAKILDWLGVHSLQHLVEYTWSDLTTDLAEHHLYDPFVLIEIHAVRKKYLPYLDQAVEAEEED